MAEPLVDWVRVSRGQEATASFARSLFLLQASHDEGWAESALQLLNAAGCAGCCGPSVVFLGDGEVETDGWRESSLAHSDLVVCCESVCTCGWHAQLPTRSCMHQLITNPLITRATAPFCNSFLSKCAATRITT